jgi:hypothetical protein
MNELIIAILSALIGAIAGYGFSSLQSKKEAIARRKVLFGQLKLELNNIGANVPDFAPDSGWVSYKSPIYIASIDQLLDGHALTYVFDSDLIKALLDLKNSVQAYNDYVQLTTLLSPSPRSVAILKGWHDKATDMFQAIKVAESNVIKNLDKLGN